MDKEEFSESPHIFLLPKNDFSSENLDCQMKHHYVMKLVWQGI